MVKLFYGANKLMHTLSIHKHAGVILCAVIAALAAWSLIRLAGVDPTVVQGAGHDQVGAGDVALAAVVAGLGAWGVHAWLPRHGAARWWPVVGSTALAVSMIGPSWMADGASAVALIGLHLVVGGILILGFARVVPGAHHGRISTPRHG
jgi:hypothetical protein